MSVPVTGALGALDKPNPYPVLIVKRPLIILSFICLQLVHMLVVNSHMVV